MQLIIDTDGILPLGEGVMSQPLGFSKLLKPLFLWEAMHWGKLNFLIFLLERQQEMAQKYAH